MGEELSPDQHKQLASRFFNAFKNAIKSYVNLSGRRVQLERLRGLLEVHYALVSSGTTLTYRVGPNKITVNHTAVYQDFEDPELARFAGLTRKGGLRQFDIHPEAVDVDDLRRLCQAFAYAVRKPAHANELVLKLWSLDTPAFSFKAIDTLDTNFWSQPFKPKAVSRVDFLKQFEHRVSLVLSPHVTKARLLQARKSLEGDVSGDSLSMESHFNIVFGKHGSGDPDKDWEDLSDQEPTIVERLATSLKEQADSEDDETLRALLRKQLHEHPPLADDSTLLRRSVRVARNLETTQPAIINGPEAAHFYLHLLRAAMACGSLPDFVDLFEEIVITDKPVALVQSIGLVGSGFAQVDEMRQFASLIERSVANRGLAATEQLVARVFIELPVMSLLSALAQLYPSVNDDETRAVFQRYLIEEGREWVELLDPLLKTDDEGMRLEGCEVLALVGGPALALLRQHLQSASEEFRHAALERVREASPRSFGLLSEGMLGPGGTP